MHGSFKFEFWPSFLALIAESVNQRKHWQQTLHGHCTALRSIMPVSWFIWDGKRPWLYVLQQIIFSQLLLRQVNPVGQPRTIPWTWSAALIASLHTPSSSELNYDSTLHILCENALGLSTIDWREFESPLRTAKVILKRSDGRKFRFTARSQHVHIVSKCIACTYNVMSCVYIYCQIQLIHAYTDIYVNVYNTSTYMSIQTYTLFNIQIRT
jgi:hypothetical protein